MVRRTEKHEPVTEHGHGNLAPHVVIPPRYVPADSPDSADRTLRQERLVEPKPRPPHEAVHDIDVPEVKWSAPGDPTSWEPGETGHVELPSADPEAHAKLKLREAAERTPFLYTDLPLQDPQSLTERLALGSADHVEVALRCLLERRQMPLEAAVAMYAAADLCAAVREHLRDSKSGERKGLAKCDHATILVEVEKTDQGPRVACISSAFNGEPGARITLTRREALIIDGSDGVPRISVRKVTWLKPMWLKTRQRPPNERGGAVRRVRVQDARCVNITPQVDGRLQAFVRDAELFRDHAGAGLL
jgi:hypothetical protein